MGSTTWPSRCILRSCAGSNRALSRHAEDKQHAVEVIDLMLHAAREQTPSPSISNHLPCTSWARMLTLAARPPSCGMSGKLRQPFLVHLAILEMISGLDEHSFLSGSLPMLRSMTVTRLETPTWGAANPMPCEA